MRDTSSTDPERVRFRLNPELEVKLSAPGPAVFLCSRRLGAREGAPSLLNTFDLFLGSLPAFS